MSEELEQVHTINLGKVLLSQPQHRAVRALNMIREFARRHMKTQSVKIDEDLARQVWSRGARSPPRKIRVRMYKTDTGDILVSRYDEPMDVEDGDSSGAPAVEGGAATTAALGAGAATATAEIPSLPEPEPAADIDASISQDYDDDDEQIDDSPDDVLGPGGEHEQDAHDENHRDGESAAADTAPAGDAEIGGDVTSSSDDSDDPAATDATTTADATTQADAKAGDAGQDSTGDDPKAKDSEQS